MLYRANALNKKAGKAWATVCLAVKKFSRMDGSQWAAAFAHYAFFSLFPSIVLFVAIASFFVDRDRAATAIIAYVETYVPIAGEKQSYIFDTIAGVIEARGQAGVIAFLMLGWAAMRFYATLIRATNRAWGGEAHKWWRLPLKSLVFLGIMVGAVLLGIAVPALAKMARDRLFPASDFQSWVYTLGSLLIPTVVVFVSLSLVYKLAPRRPIRFAEVWAPALFATVFLRVAESLFAIYLTNFAKLNAVYGAFGGIMALLLWIYLSGTIFIFGACLCAAHAETTAGEPPAARR
jgi:Ca2+-transporting ATPase